MQLPPSIPLSLTRASQLPVPHTWYEPVYKVKRSFIIMHSLIKKTPMVLLSSNLVSFKPEVSLLHSSSNAFWAPGVSTKGWHMSNCMGMLVLLHIVGHAG